MQMDWASNKKPRMKRREVRIKTRAIESSKNNKKIWWLFSMRMGLRNAFLKALTLNRQFMQFGDILDF